MDHINSDHTSTRCLSVSDVSDKQRYPQYAQTLSGNRCHFAAVSAAKSRYFRSPEKTLCASRSISDYLYRNAAYPVYQNTDITYYPEAVQGLEAQLVDLAKAEKFIFMEYHAIENADAWQKIQDVLAERAKAGVEVRVFYDDMGSISF